MAGAHRAAVLYSLIQSCKLAGVEPFAHLRDVLLRVATHPQTRIAELTPKAWAMTRSAASPSTTASLDPKPPAVPTSTPLP